MALHRSRGDAPAWTSGLHALSALSRGRVSLLLLACLLAVIPGSALTAESARPANVLVVFSNGRLLQANVDVDRGLAAQGAQPSPRAVRLFAEFLDAPAFSGESFEANTAAFLRQKYASRPPEVIVAGGAIALDFLLRHRQEMFPNAPIVHVGVAQKFVKGLAARLPPDVVGIPADYDIAGTIRLALSLHPSAQHLVVVTGSTAWDKEWQAEIRRSVADLGLVVPADYLSGLAQGELMHRLADLPRNSIVITPGYFADGTGAATTPKDSVRAMASAAAAPVYTPYSSQLGTGVVGGRMPSYEEMGRAARSIVDRIVSGTAPASLRVPESMPAPAQLDWREVRRWDIPTRLIPADAIIHYRTPTLWEAYRTQALIAIVVLLIQTGLIAALLLERRARRRTAAALADSERQMGLAVDAARLSAFVWHVDHGDGAPGRHDAGQVQGTTVETLADALAGIEPADRARVDAAVRDALAHDAQLDIEYRAVDDNGQRRWLAARGRPAAGSAGPAMTGVRMDITDRKEIELQAEADRASLRHLSRIATMGQLSAAIAHQLNQPLTAILGNAETARKMVARGRVSADELAEILDDIVTEDHRAAQVIRRLGDLYRRSDVEFARLDLNDLVRETIGLLQAELVLRHVIPTVTLAENLPPVMGNRVQLQQVLLNLVLNAADAMVHLTPDTRPLEVRTVSEGPSVKVCVSDRGEGIAEENLARVFDPFWTTKEHGLGVGLAICRAIAASHRGTLVATNNRGEGATFCFSLPDATAAEPEAGLACRVPG